MSTKRRVLLVAYQFPPVGGAGVQRVTKFAKYLPAHGWDVSVLTVSNPSVPVVDQSLLDDVPAETLICRAKSFEPDYRVKQSLAGGDAGRSRDAGRGNASQAAGENKTTTSRGGLRSWVKSWVKSAATTLLQPDPQILWAPHAIRDGLKLLRSVPHDAILVSGPPFSSFLVGAVLARRTGLPLVLDYRDEWSISNRYWENKSRNPLTLWVQRKMQRYALRRTDLAIATTTRSADSIGEEARLAGRDVPARCIFNGYDPEDVDHDATANARHESVAGEHRFRISHVGTLWNLTTSRPLVEAIERLAAESPALAARLDIEFVGRCTPGESELIERLRTLPCRLLRQDYVDHSAAVKVMSDADQLCLLLADVPGAERVVPGKTFEYLATGRELLTIAPPGELRELVQPFGGVSTFSPCDVPGIANYLARRLATPTLQAVCHRDLSRFDRRQQTGQLASLLNDLVDGTPLASKQVETAASPATSSAPPLAIDQRPAQRQQATTLTTAN